MGVNVFGGPFETPRGEIALDRSLRDTLRLVQQRVETEVWRAHAFHGANSMLNTASAHRRMGILLEECLEVVRAVNDEESLERLAEELVQVAAMAETWLLAL